MNSFSNNCNYFEHDWSNFNEENFILEYFSVDWKNTINLQKNDVNHSCQSFFDSMNDLLKIHALYKSMKKKKNLNLKKYMDLFGSTKTYFN